MNGPALCQVAFSVLDLARTDAWFRHGFGFVPAGGARQAMRGSVASRVQGLPRVASTCWWLIDDNDWFQLELFQFERPVARLMPEEQTPADIGYSRIAVWVADFDATLARLKSLGTLPITAAVGSSGERRVCVRNPDGVYVEVMEDDPLGLADPSTASVALRAVTLSVPDLDRSRSFFAGLGLSDSDVLLHRPEHESIWGLPDAELLRATYRAGSVLIELVQYADPAGRARPTDYRMCDQGILNIAFGARSRAAHQEMFDRAVRAGARANSAPVRLPGAGVVYMNDPQDFSVELLWMSPPWDRLWGFVARPAHRRPKADTHILTRTAHIAAPVGAVWDAIADHNTMGNWLGLGSVQRIVDGLSEPNGRGSERLLRLPGTRATEQVVTFERPTTYRYRVTKGSPFRCHQGEITLSQDGELTVLTWTIRFRPKVPGTGLVLRTALSFALQRVLGTGLTRYLTRSAP